MTHSDLDQFFAECKQQWEASRNADYRPLLAMWLVLQKLEPTPKWFGKAIEQLVLAKLPKYSVAEQRWLWVKSYKAEGASWRKAYERASERSRHSSKPGSPDTMRRDYMKIERARRAHTQKVRAR